MRLIQQISVVLVLIFTATQVGAKDEEDSQKLAGLIDVVVAAYGGDALTSIRNYQLSERFIALANGQSRTPALDNIGYNSQLLIRDIEGERLYFENWFWGRSGGFSNGSIVNGDQAWDINLLADTYGDAASSDPYVIAGGSMRTTDTLLALELSRAGEQAEYLGSTDYLDRDHEMIRIPFPQSPELTLYIDAQTHLISRMTRDNPQLGLLDYVFSGHVTKNGITRATRTSFFLAGKPNLVGTDSQLEFNLALADSTFTLPEGLGKEGERLDTSEVIVNRLSDNVYHIGQGPGYTLFVDTGNGIVAVGGYPGLSQRLKRFREESGSHGPLTHQVVTHHHQDHLGGIGESLDQGARLVTVSENIDTIRAAVDGDPESGRFLSVNERLTLGTGKNRVEIYEVSTLHAVNYLLVYLPGTRTLFMADHFGSPYARGVPNANQNTLSMHESLKPLKLNYNRIVTAHNGRVFSAGDFSKSVAGFKDAACPADRPLCQGV